MEVHHGLFSAERRAGSDKVFSRENLLAQSRPSRFQGMEVRGLSLELELVYVASHWAQYFIMIADTSPKQQNSDHCWSERTVGIIGNP